jgi:hypothetical protein
MLFVCVSVACMSVCSPFQLLNQSPNVHRFGVNVVTLEACPVF